VDAERFDRWTQGLDTRLSRRSLSGLAAGALATLGLGAAAVDAKKKNKKKKKKNKNNNNVPPIVPPGVNTTCQNLTTACGNTAICRCGLDKNSVQTCFDFVNPPNGVAFTDICQQNINCGPGEVCLVGANVCVRTCAN
jgi:hypothetical protein